MAESSDPGTSRPRGSGDGGGTEASGRLRSSTGRTGVRCQLGKVGPAGLGAAPGAVTALDILFFSFSAKEAAI